MLCVWLIQRIKEKVHLSVTDSVFLTAKNNIQSLFEIVLKMNLEIFPDKSTNKNRFQHQKLCFGFLLFSRNSQFPVFSIFAEKKYIMIIGQNLVLVAKNIESFPPLSSIPSCLIDVNINIHKHRSPFSPPSLTFGLKCQGRKFEHGNAKNPKLLQKHLMMIIMMI